ncbi:DUF2868 domain-containing protein [Entomomonas asaccharolytica]|uniref:DUF2868 domain-containing protein n=1 Tax=Entomomonas asaccharolytica TaxID=2785331 RepID=A0A974NDH2_9GAMM|nr:DUF2868 domain-containing protein [Entomomonas asaccharolytica]QQP84462.1 DUF2868 domain-containing protein [Entomomonas asaccharolytica]
MAKQTNQQHFNDLWLAETIRLQEEQQGVLADSEAVRQARKAGGDIESRILTRAQWLANKTGLMVAQQSTLTAMYWSVRILCVLAVFIGIGLVLPTFSAVEHTINIFSALGCLLGLNILMLIIWLVGTFAGGQSVNQLGRFSLWLTSKLSGKKQVVQLMPALVNLLHQRKLERWWLGRLTNGLWLLASIIALLSLLLLLATQRYGFIWQTTILSADSFVMVVQVLGTLPHILGFPIPSEELIRQSGDMAIMSDTARQTWAAWLVGVLVVYGILPRLVLFLLCSSFWRYGYKRLGLDLALPSYSLLKSRLLPDTEIIGVTDAVPTHWSELAAASAHWSEHGAVLVGIELEANYPWPPANLSEHVVNAGVIETREQRKQILDQLTINPVAKLLIVCDPRRSVDRGTLALITELAQCATETRVYLLEESDTDAQRLADWQQTLNQLQLTYGDKTSLLAWLGAEDD